jgi:hypothetical protein
MIHEQAERPEQIRAMFEEICCGNQDAVHTCWAVFQFLHVIDDLVDRDHDLPIETVGLSLLAFTEAVAANPFFQANRDILLGHMRVAVLEWVDSERWRKREDLREKIAAEVLKSQYQNFFYLIASLCGGLSHMSAITQKYRQYHWD